jgi:ribose-phosphate pyrophosphokinase
MWFRASAGAAPVSVLLTTLMVSFSSRATSCESEKKSAATPTRRSEESVPSTRNGLDQRPRFFARDIMFNKCAQWEAEGLPMPLPCADMRARLANAMLLPGSSNPALNEEISYESGLNLASVDVSRFADGECNVKINEDVSGRDVFVIQAASPPINDSMIEALLLVSAARRADARSITLVAPSLPYCQDSGLSSALGHLQRHGIISGGSGDAKTADGLIGEGIDDAGAASATFANQSLADIVRAEADAVVASAANLADATRRKGSSGSDEEEEVVAPLSAADVARLFVTAGVDRVISVDIAPPGTGQFEGFYPPSIPIESLRSNRIFVDVLARMKLDRPVVVAPHEGCIQLAADVRHGLQTRLNMNDETVGIAVIVETGSSGKDRFVQHTKKGGIISTSRGKKGALSLQLIGDVKGRDVIIADHLIDTAKTLVDRTALLKAAGARRVVALATHAIFSGQALQRIAKSPLSDVLVSNTIPLRDDVTMRHSHKIVTGEFFHPRCPSPLCPHRNDEFKKEELSSFPGRATMTPQIRAGRPLKPGLPGLTDRREHKTRKRFIDIPQSSPRLHTMNDHSNSPSPLL